jgi:conjugal transfer mating pair stabilization protein TraN
VDIKITKTMDIKETFVDDPPGCRQRIFDAWPLEGDTPPFDNTGSPEAEASTAWWACTDAAYSRFFDGIEITSTDYGPLIADILPEPPDMPPAPICYKAKTRVPQETTFCWTDPEGVEHCTDYQYGESDTCGEYADNPQCAYVSEECLTVDPATGECQA